MNKTVLITLNEVIESLNKLSRDVIAFDVETTSLVYSDLELEGISLCDDKYNVYIYLMGRDENNNVVFNNPETDEILKELNNYFKQVKVCAAHNIVFDLSVLYKYNVHIPNELFCTMTADHLIDERRRHGLKHLAVSILGEDATDEYSKASQRGTASKQFFEYAMKDTRLVYNLMYQQKIQLIEQGLVELFRNIEMPFQRVLCQMRTTGVCVDLEEVEQTTKLLKKQVEDLIVEMLQELGEKYQIQIDLTGKSTVISSINFSSPQQLSNILFDKLGLEVIENTPSGARSVGKKTIETYKDRNKFVDLLYKYKAMSKLLSAFFTPLPSFVESDGRIRPGFHNCGTETGRLSCSRPNFQQLPRYNKDVGIDTRKAFIVPKGYKMMTIDYSSQEIRVMAQISKDKTLIDSLNKGQDMHLKIANQFFELGIPEEALYSTHEDYKKYKSKFKDERTKAKTITFGLCYGKGAYGFSKDFGITEDEAQEIIDKYFRTMPQLKEAIAKSHRDIKSRGYVSSMFGRRRRFTKINDEYYSKKSLRQGFNFLIQSASADMIRLAAVKVYELSKQHPEYEILPIMTVHDEISFSIKEEYVEEASKKINKAFESAVEFVVPLTADYDIGENYGECK